MAVDIVIVSYNTRDLLRACLESVRRFAAAADVTCLVVDNASRDDSAQMAAESFPEAKLIPLERNIGFGPANNRALEAGCADLVLFLNPDAELTAGALPRLRAFMDEHADCVIAGPALRYPGGRFQASCRRVPTPLRALWSLAGFEARFPRACAPLRNWFTEAEHRHDTAVDMVSGACFIARRAYLDAVGGFDEDLFMYEEETDLMLPARRMRKTVRYCAEAVVLHHGGASVEASALSDFSVRQLFRSKYRCFRKHYGPRAARRTYRYDRAVLGASAAWNRLRGTPSEAARRLRLAKRAWRESYCDVAALRADAAFFHDEP